jgi:uncharacterized protein YoxC
MSTVHALVLLSVVLGAVTILVLAVALIQVQRGLASAAKNLKTLDDALKMVESEHLQPLRSSVEAINAQFEIALGRLPGIARKAAVVAERRPR